MAQRISKTGKRYTAGSQATRGHYPPVCSGCGQKVVMSHQTALWFETLMADNVACSWHHACRMRALSAERDARARDAA